MSAPTIDINKLMRTILHALRHDPASYRLEMDPEGWVSVRDLVVALQDHHFAWSTLDEEHIATVVREIGPSRFEMNLGRIRATYGHSISVLASNGAELPPECLYHATSAEVLFTILSEGLRPMGRQFVHLTADVSYAGDVAMGKGLGVILVIKARQAHECGLRFRRANHHVWLAETVFSR